MNLPMNGWEVIPRTVISSTFKSSTGHRSWLAELVLQLSDHIDDETVEAPADAA